MKDSGKWFFRELLDVPTPALEDFLNELIDNSKKPASNEQMSVDEFYKQIRMQSKDYL